MVAWGMAGQKFSRTLKTNLVNAIQETFGAVASDSVQVLRTNDGITLALDTNVGFISIVINPTIKNLDYEPFEEADLFKVEQEEKAAKAKAAAAAKAAKIAKDKAVRAKAKEAAEAAEAAV